MRSDHYILCACLAVLAIGIACPAAAAAGSWHITTVDNTGKFTSLAVDSGGFSRISYWDYTHNDLKYAWQDKSGWHTTTVDSTGDVGICTSLAIGQDGYSRISYTDIGNYDLKYAWQDAAGWHTTTVDGAGNTGWLTSLAIGPDGYPRISYVDRRTIICGLPGRMRAGGRLPRWIPLETRGTTLPSRSARTDIPGSATSRSVRG